MTSTKSAIEPPTPPSRPPVWRRRVFVILLAASLGAGLGVLVKSRIGNPAPAVADAPLALQTWVVTERQASDTRIGRIALPAGARFQLRIRSAQPGRVRISKPGSEVAQLPVTLWDADIVAGKAIESPAFRMTGQRGGETLEVVLYSGQKVASRQVVELWQY